MRRLTLLPDATRCTAAILCLGFVAFAVANVPTATGADYPKQNHPPDRRFCRRLTHDSRQAWGKARAARHATRMMACRGS
jgi:hypothetical protein